MALDGDDMQMLLDRANHQINPGDIMEMIDDIKRLRLRVMRLEQISRQILDSDGEPSQDRAIQALSDFLAFDP